MIYVIDPSHIHSDFTHIIDNELKTGILFKNCILDPYIGIPNWSSTIFDKLTEYKKQNVHLCWIVSDYKFNNFEYNKIIELQNSNNLFLNTLGERYNVSKEFMELHHIELLGHHSLRVIDYIINQFPDIKLIFWCLYKRTKANKNSSYPKHLHYDALKERYAKNIIDINLYISDEEFNNIIIDDGGHPNKEGYELLDRMIADAFTDPQTL